MAGIKIKLKLWMLIVSIWSMSACSMQASITDMSSQLDPEQESPDTPSVPNFKNPEYSSGETIVTEHGTPGYKIQSSLYKISEGEMISSSYQIRALVQ